MQSLKAASTLDSLAAIHRYVLDAAAAAGLSKEAAYRLRLAVDEIATNVVTHGYLEAGLQGSVDLHGCMEDRTLTLVLEDTAAAFDPHSVPPPDDIHLPAEQRKIGGLGVYLAMQSVDRFHYERVGGRNRNVFIMNRPLPAPVG